MREISIRQASRNFTRIIMAAERGETIVITRNGIPVARISPRARNRADDPQWRSAFAALKKSLRSKRGFSYRVGRITEDDTYDDSA
jgi:prevent-host-death family protein